MIWVLVVLIIAAIVLLPAGRRLFSMGIRPPATGEDDGLTKALQRHVYKLSHKIGVRNITHYGRLSKAAAYIAGEFSKLGYKVEFQPYEAEGRTVKNIVAIRPGTAPPDRIVVIGAHYDTDDNPGADDNASGIAALLELARLTAGHPANNGMEFVAFVNEEPPFFHSEKMGSRVYTKLAKQKGKNIKAGLVLEMLGYYTDEVNSQQYPESLKSLSYPDRANFLAIVGNQASNRLAAEIINGFKHNTSFPIEQIAAEVVPEGDFSDHWSFWQEGYPAVMITDTSFYRYVHYHQSTDTYEKLNYRAMSEVVRGLYAVIIDLSSSP